MAVRMNVSPEFWTMERARVMWTEYDVRRLLRVLRKPQRLESMPLARALCDATEIADPYKAVLSMIDRTFADRGYHAQRLRELIWRSDVDASGTQQVVAYEMHLSARQFFRYRSDAIKALAATINRLFETRNSVRDPIEALAELTSESDPEAALAIYDLSGGSSRSTLSRIDAALGAGKIPANPTFAVADGSEALISLARIAQAYAWDAQPQRAEALTDKVRSLLFSRVVPDRSHIEFELSRVEYIRARQANNAYRMTAIAERLQLIAADDPTLQTRSLLAVAEARLRSGQFNEANNLCQQIAELSWRGRDVRAFGAMTLLLAQLVFASGDTGNALTLAQAARFSLHRVPDHEYSSETVVNRLRLAAGMKPTPGFTSGEGTTYQEVSRRGIEARFAINAAELRRAEDLAQSQLHVSEQLGFDGLTAWAKATLGSAALQSNEDERQALSVEAWSGLLACGDYVLARDAFLAPSAKPVDLGPLRYGRDFEFAVGEGLAQLFPSTPLAVPDVRKHFGKLAGSIAFALVNGDAPSSDAAIDAIAAKLAEARVTSSVFRRHQRSIIPTLGFFIAALLPFEARAHFQTRFEQDLGEAFVRIFRALPPGPAEKGQI
ncbi:MAG: hypothetical protein JOZ38_01545 [Candidatus Eremiobacteraeota bacterium]|nr:hypothetical protein [Candidatus Eremiobacteraeota bacterium]